VLDGSDGNYLTTTTPTDGSYSVQQFSVEILVKISKTDIWGGGVISYGNNYSLYITPEGNLRFSTHNGNFVWDEYVTTGVNVADNVWHDIAVTKSASQLVVYVDGVAIQTFSATNAIVYSLGTSLVVGAHGDGDTNFSLTGSVDYIRLWIRPLTAAEVSTHRQSGIGQTPTGLNGQWTFDAVADNSTVANDTSENTNHLTVRGTPVFVAVE
jgi:hypothetical protein